MSWKKILKNNIVTLEELKQHIKLKPKEEKELRKIIQIHPLCISKHYLSNFFNAKTRIPAYK